MTRSSDEERNELAAAVPQNNVSLENNEISLFREMWEVIKTASPMMLGFSMSFILIASAMFADRSNDDDEHVAATTLFTAMANTTSAIAFGPLFAIGLIMSRLWGEYDDNVVSPTVVEERGVVEAGEEERPLVTNKKRAVAEQMAYYNRNSLLLATIVFPIPTLILAYSEFILSKIFGQNENVARIAQEYLRPFSIGMFGWGWRVVNEQVMYSRLKQKVVSAVCVANFILATGLAALLTSDKVNTKISSLEAVALAYVAEAFLTPLILTAYMLVNKEFREVGFFRKWNWNLKRDREQLAEIVKIAAPMALAFFNEFGAQLVMNNLQGVISTRALAAQNFMSQFYFFAYFPLITFGVAASQGFGRLHGAGKYEQARVHAIGGMLSVGGVVTVLAVGVSAYPEGMAYLLVNQKGNDSSWFPILRVLAPINALGTIFDALGFNMLSVLRAGGDNAVSSTLSSVVLWGGIGLGASIAFPLKAHGLEEYAPYGLAGGYTAGLIIRAALLGARWRIMINTDNQRELKKTEGKSIFQENYCRSLFFCCSRKGSTPSAPTQRLPQPSGVN